MSSLVKYEAARHALSLAVEVDEVKDIRDKAEAMAAYARQAKDTELVKWATEIKVRAERKAGQMLAEMPKQDGGHAAKVKARSHDVTEVPKTLAELGISKNDSSRWQKLAAVTESQFEQAVAAAKEIAGEVTTAAMLRATKAETTQDQAAAIAKPLPRPSKPEPKPEVEEDGAPDQAEFDSVAAAEKAEMMAMRLLLASDEPLADVTAKYEQAVLQIERLNARIVGLQNQSTQQIKTIKSLQAKLKKLEQAA